MRSLTADCGSGIREEDGVLPVALLLGSVVGLEDALVHKPTEGRAENVRLRADVRGAGFAYLHFELTDGGGHAVTEDAT
jgi:hypothetical protein